MWLSNQRSRRELLELQQQERLDALDISWSILSDQWESNFTALKAFHDREGHCVVHVNRTEAGLKIGKGVSRNSAYHLYKGLG